MRRIMSIVTVVAMSVALGSATANAKAPPKERASSSSYTVAADYGFNESNDPYFHVEAFKNAQGPAIGFLEWNQNYVCDQGNPDDPYDDQWVRWMFDFTGENPVAADTFTIGNRNSSAFVAGWVHGGVDIQNDCTGEETWYGQDVYVTIDLTGTDGTIRETNSSWFRSPEFKSTESFSFTGRTATGTVTFAGENLFGQTSYSDVGGRIGLSKYRSMQIG